MLDESHCLVTVGPLVLRNRLFYLFSNSLLYLCLLFGIKGQNFLRKVWCDLNFGAFVSAVYVLSDLLQSSFVVQSNWTKLFLFFLVNSFEVPGILFILNLEVFKNTLQHLDFYV